MRGKYYITRWRPSMQHLCNIRWSDWCFKINSSMFLIFNKRIKRTARRKIAVSKSKNVETTEQKIVLLYCERVRQVHMNMMMRMSNNICGGNREASHVFLLDNVQCISDNWPWLIQTVTMRLSCCNLRRRHIMPTCNVLVMGARRVGKTSLVNSFITGSFNKVGLL